MIIWNATPSWISREFQQGLYLDIHPRWVYIMQQLCCAHPLSQYDYVVNCLYCYFLFYTTTSSFQAFVLLTAGIIHTARWRLFWLNGGGGEDVSCNPWSGAAAVGRGTSKRRHKNARRIFITRIAQISFPMAGHSTRCHKPTTWYFVLLPQYVVAFSRLSYR